MVARCFSDGPAKDRHRDERREEGSPVATDDQWISLLRTVPAFITNLTRSSSVMSESGSPETATRSANLPASTEPIRSLQPKSSAATAVPHRLARTGLLAYLTQESKP